VALPGVWRVSEISWAQGILYSCPARPHRPTHDINIVPGLRLYRYYILITGSILRGLDKKNAVAFEAAKLRGIPVSTDVAGFVESFTGNLIINATGDRNLEASLAPTLKSRRIEFILWTSNW